MKKKLFSMILAIAMLASLAIPAFASSTSSGNRNETLNYAATTEIPPVTVTMPTTHSLALNPYGMTVSISGTEYSDQIISPVQYIKNETRAALKVAVKATATLAGNAVLSAKPCTGKETTLSAFLMAELAQSANTTEPTWIADLDDANTINEKCYPQIIPTAEGKTATGILSVDRTDTTTTENYIALKIMGNLAGNPTGGWTAADKVDVKLEFTFTPGVANTVTVPSGITASKASAVMGTVVRLTTDGKQPTVTDANTNAVSVTKVTDTLYYFTMPATAVTVAAGT